MNEQRADNIEPSESSQSFANKLVSGGYGLAITYWMFYFLGAGLFFVFGSQAVDAEQWLRFLACVALMMGYTILLVAGVRAAYKGPQMWKVISRTSSVFMIINILVGISTLGFVY